MTQKDAIKLFEERKIRTVWDEDQEKWYFSVVDIVSVLTDSANPTDYLKKVRKRDSELGLFMGTNCPQVMMMTETGKRRKTLAADTESLFRIIQSIPSPKAEQALLDYKRLGYSDNWINQRLKSIEVRKELTDEWKCRGVKEGVQFAALTDIITQAWAGLTTREYKQLKGLKKENLRDNMTNMELILNMLAEAKKTEKSKERERKTFEENRHIANQGGQIAGNTRKEIEIQTGKSIISPLNAKDYLQLGNSEKDD